MEILKENWIKIPAVLYVLGFLVHNIWLSEYHSSSFDLLQAKYIFSGFAFLVFLIISFVVVSLRVNLSNIIDSYRPDKLAPWLLRICCFPYIVYGALNDGGLFALDFASKDIAQFEFFLFYIKSLATLIFILMMMDVVYLYSDGEALGARVFRKIIRVISIPMILATLGVAVIDHEFGSLLRMIFFFFFGLIGVAMYQQDKLHGFDVNLLDKNAHEDHESTYSVFFWVCVNCFFDICGSR